MVKTVVRLDDGRSTSFRGHRLASHRIDFRDDSYAKFRIGFSNSNCSAQAGSTGSENQDVMLKNLMFFHQKILTSGQIPVELMRTYTSEKPTKKGLISECVMLALKGRPGRIDDEDR